MEFYDLIKERRSIRRFKDGVVPENVINRVLECVKTAPSAGNMQSFRIGIYADRNTKEALLNAAYNQDFIREAPIVLVFFANQKESAGRYGKRGEKLYALQDATIAALYAHLAAADMGLGSVWVGSFDTKKVKKILGAGIDLIPIVLLPIGYPAESPSANPRKDIMDLIVRDERED